MSIENLTLMNADSITSGVREVIIGVIAGVITLIIGYYLIDKRRKQKEKLEQETNKEMEHKNEKIRICRIILSEVKVNQSRLKPLSDSTNKILFMSMYDWIRVILGEKDKLPNMLIFGKKIYSGLSDKLWVLDDAFRNKLVQYYFELEYIEEEYKKLDIQGGSYLHLVYLPLRENEKSKMSKSRWDEIDGFLRNTKKEYDLGEELMKDLNTCL